MFINGSRCFPVFCYQGMVLNVVLQRKKLWAKMIGSIINPVLQVFIFFDYGFFSQKSADVINKI